MTINTFYRLVVWLPLLFPAVVAGIVHGVGVGVQHGPTQDIVEVLLMSLLYGGVPYGVLAVWATVWIGGKEEAQIRRLMFRAPLLMAAVFAPVAMLAGLIVGAPGPFAAVAVLGALASVVVGYVYVLVVMLIREELPTTLSGLS